MAARLSKSICSPSIAALMSRAEFADFVKAEYVRWEGIVKNAGVVKE